MDLSFQKFFDLGIVMPASFPELGAGNGPIFERMDAVLSTHLFTLLEITYQGTEQDFIDLGKYLDRKEIRTIYLAPSAIQERRLDPNSLNEPERRKAVEVLKGFVENAYLLRAERLMVCSGPDPGSEDREKAKRQLIQSLNELLEWTHRVKTDYLLELILENFDRELQKKRLLGPTHESVELIMEVKKDFGNINLIIDQSHLRQLGEDPQASLSLARNCLGHVHLANCLLKDRAHPQWGDSHLAFNTEGGELGTDDIVEMFHTLFQVGYLREGGSKRLPAISLEVKPTPPGSDPFATFKATCNTFLEAWGKFNLRRGT